MNAISIFAEIVSFQMGQVKNKAPAMSRGFNMFIINCLSNKDDDVSSG